MFVCVAAKKKDNGAPGIKMNESFGKMFFIFWLLSLWK